MFLPGLSRRHEVPDGGGLTAEGRARREKVRLQAARMFEQGMDPERVARCLRVSTKPAYQWRRSWRAGGEAGLASKGPGGNEGVWANMKNGLVNLAACTADQLTAIVRTWLKRIQYRPALVNGFLAQTGLTLEPEPP